MSISPIRCLLSSSRKSFILKSKRRTREQEIDVYKYSPNIWKILDFHSTISKTPFVKEHSFIHFTVIDKIILSLKSEQIEPISLKILN